MTTGDTVIGYARVSKGAKNGVSLDVQERAIHEECKRRGWRLLRIERETLSGKRKTSRPGLDRALTACADGEASAIVVYKLDRLSRSVIDAGHLLERAQREGWNVVALDFGLDLSTPNGKLVANVLTSVAEWEREMIALRTSEALAEKAAQGMQLGRPREVSDQAVKRIRELRRRGRKQRSLSEIARTLNDEHLPTPRGGRWHPSSVKRVLSRDT
jgi:DNA invertase Pin-like site-specific DNA recombinase